MCKGAVFFVHVGNLYFRGDKVFQPIWQSALSLLKILTVKISIFNFVEIFYDFMGVFSIFFYYGCVFFRFCFQKYGILKKIKKQGIEKFVDGCEKTDNFFVLRWEIGKMLTVIEEGIGKRSVFLLFICE